MNGVKPSRAESWRRPGDAPRNIRMVRAGGRALRIAPWPADGRTAQLSVAPGELAPTQATVHAALREAASAGYDAAVTAALGPAERVPFAAAGFEPLAWLYLLDRDVDDVPAATTDGPELRRVHRADWPALAALDARAFPSFWYLGVAGIADARHATPSNRVRVAVAADGDIGGYAVFGRSGTRGFLQRLAVDPGAQRQGLGTALVFDGLRWMRARGAANVLVNTQVNNQAALALYLRLGFRLKVERLAVLGRPVGGAA